MKANSKSFFAASFMAMAVPLVIYYMPSNAYADVATVPIPEFTTWVSHPTLLRTSQFRGRDGSTCGTDYETCIGTAREPSGTVFTAKCFVAKNTTNCPKDGEIAEKCVRLGQEEGAASLREAAKSGNPNFTAAAAVACTASTPACTANGANDGRAEGCRCTAAAVTYPGADTTCVRTYHQCRLNKTAYQKRLTEADAQCRFDTHGALKKPTECKEFCGRSENIRAAPCKRKGVRETILFEREGCHPLERLNVYDTGTASALETGMFCTPHSCTNTQRWSQGASNGNGACLPATCETGKTWNARTGQCQTGEVPAICTRCTNLTEATQGTGWGFDPVTCLCNCFTNVVRAADGKLNCVEEADLPTGTAVVCPDRSLVRDPDATDCRRRCTGGQVFTAIIPSATEGGADEVQCQACPEGSVLDPRLEVNHCRPVPPTAPAAE